MNQHSQPLFFIALLPPDEIQEIATRIKREFAEIYHSHAALKSPPHVTLYPPFRRDLAEFSHLDRCLAEFAKNRSPVPMTLENFNAFKPRVIYIDVPKTPELVALQTQLLDTLASEIHLVDPTARNRPFSPHLTVAFRDLTKSNFQAAWSEYRMKKLYFQFTVDRVTLLQHNGQHWTVQQEYLLQGRSNHE